MAYYLSKKKWKAQYFSKVDIHMIQAADFLGPR